MNSRKQPHDTPDSDWNRFGSTPMVEAEYLESLAYTKKVIAAYQSSNSNRLLLEETAVVAADAEIAKPLMRAKETARTSNDFVAEAQRLLAPGKSDNPFVAEAGSAWSQMLPPRIQDDDSGIFRSLKDCIPCQAKT